MEPHAYRELAELEPSHWWYCGMRAIMDALLAQVIGQRSDLRILDAGCGVGGNLSHLQPLGQVYGCDYAPLALHYARQQHKRLAQATVECLPYGEGSFDLVTSFDVLYAQEVGDDRLALREMCRVLAPDGYLLLRLPALASLAGQHDVVVHGARRYSRSEVEEKLRQVGLKPLYLGYANSLLFPFIYALRRWQGWRGQAERTAPSDVRPTPQPLNTLLCSLLKLEAAWIKRGYHLPIGVSVIALAQKVSL